MTACLFVFIFGLIFGFAGAEDYNTRGGSDYPYPWEKPIVHYSCFLMLLGVVMMVMCWLWD